MTLAPPIPGAHTLIMDARLIVAGEPLFQVPPGYTVTGATPLYLRPDGYMECRIIVKKVDKKAKGIDKTDNSPV